MNAVVQSASLEELMRLASVEEIEAALRVVGREWIRAAAERDASWMEMRYLNRVFGNVQTNTTHEFIKWANRHKDKQLPETMMSAILEIEKRADRLRGTADELQRGKIHPAHAANRIRRIANEISQPKSESFQQEGEKQS